MCIRMKLAHTSLLCILVEMRNFYFYFSSFIYAMFTVQGNYDIAFALELNQVRDAKPNRNRTCILVKMKE